VANLCTTGESRCFAFAGLGIGLSSRGTWRSSAASPAVTTSVAYVVVLTGMLRLVRSAAQLLLIETSALRPVLENLDLVDFDKPTVCTGWSVRDVLGHCGAALTRVVADDLHEFSAADNEADVVERRGWSVSKVLEELFVGYGEAAIVIDRVGGRLDGVGLGEWMHGGDVREAVGAPHPYTSEGAGLALGLLLERSAGRHRPHGQTSRRAVADKPVLDILVDGEAHRFGGGGGSVGALPTDLETFVRLCGGQRPDPERYDLAGAAASDLVLFG
jgi:uncharacterized protein (TIGR03083 family)